MGLREAFARSELDRIDKECGRECTRLRREAEKKKLKLVKEELGFEKGSRVRYTDRDGYMEGEFISMDSNGKVAVLVDLVNGSKHEPSLSLFHYSELV